MNVTLDKWAVNNCGSLTEFKNYVKQTFLVLYGDGEWDYINFSVENLCNKLIASKKKFNINKIPSEILGEVFYEEI